MLHFNDIRNDERVPAGAAFVTLLGITAGHTLLETARDSLFLARLPVARLPWMYLAIAAVGLLFSRIGTRNAERLRALDRQAVVIAVVVAALVSVVFWRFSATSSVIFVYALYVWTGVFASWVVVRVWTSLGQVFDVSQAKRLYGPIGAGGVLGAVVGSTFARALAAYFPARHLLLGAAVLLLVTVPPATIMARFQHDEPTVHGSRAASMEDMEALRGQPYVKRILFLVMGSTVTVTLIDFVFKGAVAKHVPAPELASFFATFAIVLNVLSLVIQIAGVSALLRLVGVHRALWLFPVLLAFGTTGVIVMGGLVTALLLKGADGALRYSLHRTTVELLFVPLPDALRRRAKPFIDLAGQRGGQAIASVIILIAIEVGIGRRALAVGIAVLLVGWLVTASSLRKHYLDLFRSTLRQGAIGPGGALPPLDLDALETLFAALNSARDDEVVAALDLLAEQQRAKLIPALILYHPAPQVVLAALDLMVAAGRDDFAPIADRLLAHADPAVRASALRARMALMPDEEVLRKHAAGDAEDLRVTAVVGLLHNGWIAPDEARARLLSAAESASIDTRLALVRALREHPLAALEDVLLTLLRSHESVVLVDALSALAQLKSERAVPAIIGLLESHEVRGAARAALSAIGEPARAPLVRALTDRAVPLAVRGNVPRAIADVDPSWAVTVLLDSLVDEDDGLIRFRVLRALGRLRRSDPGLVIDREKLYVAGRQTIRAALRYLDWRVSLEQAAREDPSRATPAQQLMVALLRDKEGHAVERVFRLLGLSYPGEDFERIFRGLKSATAKARASGRELIENLLPSPVRELTLALTDDAPDSERLARVSEYYTRDALPYQPLLALIRERGGDTLAALVAYHVGELGFEAVREAPRAPATSSRFVEDVVERARSLIAVPPASRPAHG
jgi:AAA family ATP:ADP antiporter